MLLPNPRGSYGSGEAFTQANVNDFGYGDLRDIEAGVDAAVKAAPIDPARTGIIGWSYGGYMTMWAVTQTTRFKAAVAGAGIANWQSYYGQNKIDTWMLPFFGASVYDEPEVYSRSSPITFIKKVKTPTLVLHGDRDSEVPTPQGYEFWHALKALNVPTELVIYPEEGHAISKPAHQRDIEERLAGVVRSIPLVRLRSSDSAIFAAKLLNPYRDSRRCRPHRGGANARLAVRRKMMKRLSIAFTSRHCCWAVWASRRAEIRVRDKAIRDWGSTAGGRATDVRHSVGARPGAVLAVAADRRSSSTTAARSCRRARTLSRSSGARDGATPRSPATR